MLKIKQFYRNFGFIGLSIFVCCAAEALNDEPSKRAWLNVQYSQRFSYLENLNLIEDQSYADRIASYFRKRGVDDLEAVHGYVRTDLRNLAEGLSALFNSNHEAVLKDFMGEYFSITEGTAAQIDHVGRELLGPLKVYLEALKRHYPELNLDHRELTGDRVYTTGDLVFPSTQVVKSLQTHDPEVKGVTIGRVYLKDKEQNSDGCLELFQVATMDDDCPQNIDKTLLRLKTLQIDRNDRENGQFENPIDHIAVRLGSREDISIVHERIHKLAASNKQILAYQDEVSHNPADGSFNTKFMICPSDGSVCSKIIEFVYYESFSEKL